ncbi:MAG: hypothetical protein ACM3XM_19930 [Mycobacterium leprae]
MTRPIESVVAELQACLERSDQQGVATVLATYPEYTAELEELIPVILELDNEKRWRQAEFASHTFALKLHAELVPRSATSAATIGDLFTQDRVVSGLSIEEQARRSGLPVDSLEQLSRAGTPTETLSDNAAVRQLAAKVSAPFSALLKEVRRLLSLNALNSMQSGMVFTRDKETSTEAERQALLEKVRSASRKPPDNPRRCDPD